MTIPGIGGPPGGFPHGAGFTSYIAVSSDAQLANRIAAWQPHQNWAALPHQQPISIAAAIPTGSIIRRGDQLLLAIGQATNPIVSALPIHPSNWWPIVRYYWAFDRNAAGFMCLSPQGQALRYHHRTALSEYVGIGVAIELVKEIVSQQYPNSAIQVIDADLALDNAQIPGVAGVGRLRPDYFVTVQNGPVIVLECKGSSSAQNRVSAIGKAMRQLASVSHNGTHPKGYAVHTIAGSGAIDATILTPTMTPQASGRLRLIEVCVRPPRPRRPELPRTTTSPSFAPNLKTFHVRRFFLGREREVQHSRYCRSESKRASPQSKPICGQPRSRLEENHT